MLNEFSRTQLLLGQEAMGQLARARVAVFGIGGVGGYTVEAVKYLCKVDSQCRGEAEDERTVGI